MSMLWSEADRNKPDKPSRLNLSRRRFERLVTRALISLPQEFQSRLRNVAVIIEDEPPDYMPDTMGLYEGTPLIHRWSDDIALPDQITIFKGSIERACRTEKEIEHEVRVTVLHEVGHYFGLDEAQLE
jgi:predicted Zn-dependent protease with MMP-like domain